MRPRLRTALFLLLAGALANVAIAWSCIVASPTDAWGFAHPDSWRGDAPSEADIALLAARGETPAPGSVVEVRTGFGWQLRAVAIDYSATDHWVTLDDYRDDFWIDTLWPSLTRVRAGWPAPSFQGYVWIGSGADKRSSIVKDPLEHLFTIPEDGILRQVEPKLVPIAPLLAGFALNSVTLGLLLAVPAQLYVVLVRWLRVRRQRCLRCKYALAGLRSGVCPECGTLVPTSGIYTLRLPSVRLRPPPLRVTLLVIAGIIATLLTLYLLQPVA